MPRTDVSRRLPYPWQDVYGLVLDVESYPRFVPFCRTTKLLEKNGDNLVARMEVGFSSIKENYTSEIKGLNFEKKIEIRAIDGPFKQLNGVWSFAPIDERSTNVRFTIEYEFRNRLLAIVEAKAFGLIFGQLVTAFEKRADLVLSKT